MMKINLYARKRNQFLLHYRFLHSIDYYTLERKTSISKKYLNIVKVPTKT